MATGQQPTTSRPESLQMVAGNGNRATAFAPQVGLWWGIIAFKIITFHLTLHPKAKQRRLQK